MIRGGSLGPSHPKLMWNFLTSLVLSVIYGLRIDGLRRFGRIILCDNIREQALWVSYVVMLLLQLVRQDVCATKGVIWLSSTRGSFTGKGRHTLKVCIGADRELKVSVLHMQSHQHRSSVVLATFSTPHSSRTWSHQWPYGGGGHG